MKLVFELLLVATGLTLTEGLICQMCNGDECASKGGYQTENCPPGARFCYTLIGERGNIYRNGCAFTDCSRIQMSRTSECTVCDVDNCNRLDSDGHDEKDSHPETENSNVKRPSASRNGSSNPYASTFIAFLFISRLIF